LLSSFRLIEVLDLRYLIPFGNYSVFGKVEFEVWDLMNLEDMKTTTIVKMGLVNEEIELFIAARIILNFLC